MKMISSLAILSLLFPALMPAPARAATAEDCAKNYKINVDKPYSHADGAEETSKKLCTQNGANSACGKSYSFMWERYSDYSRRSTEICQSVIKNQQNLTGVGNKGFKEINSLSSDAKDQFTSLKKEQEADMTRLAKFRNQNLDNAERAVANSNESIKKSVGGYVKQLKEARSMSGEELTKLSSKISKDTTIPAGTREELIAAAHSVRFSTMVGQDAKARGDAAGALGNNADTANDRDKKSGSSSGFDMKDAGGMLGLATAGMGLMSALKGGQATPSSDLSSAAPPAAPEAAPAVATLPVSEAGGASVGSAGTDGTSFAGPNTGGQSVTKLGDSPGGNGGPPPAASMSDPKDSVLNQFGGALGGSPFSGSATSAGAGGGSFGADGSGRSPASEAGAHAGGGAGESGLLPAGGGLPGFAGGGGSSSGSSESSLKDLFKGDPFAMPTGGAGADAAAGALTAAAGENLEGASLLGEDAQSGPFPGANDARDLFLRVKDFHKRCIKRGMVTSEAGGKI